MSYTANQNMLSLDGLNKSPMCGCMNKMRVQLRPLNGSPVAERASGAALIFIGRIDKSGPYPPIVTAAFCPFCGASYQ